MNIFPSSYQRVLLAHKLKNEYGIRTVAIPKDNNVLVKCGFNDLTIKHFNLEYSNKGSFKRRVVFPIWHKTIKGNIEVLTFCGIFEEDIENIKYFPLTNESLIVDDILYAIHLYQMGIENVVAILSDTLSSKQIKLMKERKFHFTVLQLNIKHQELDKDIKLKPY